MSEEDAEKVWDLIRGTFALSNAEKVAPDPEEIWALNAYKSGDEDYQPSLLTGRAYKRTGIIIEKTEATLFELVV